mgnify:CR=1 FL=1
MPTLKQKSSFGPGKYRGIAFDRDRLLRYVEGTNKAIAAGVPIPLLDRKHAKPGATDKETADEADAQGVGWLTKLSLDANDSIEWEAKDVPQAVIDDVRNGHKRFTSPEFRDSYTNEKEGVYEGPIVRHITFTPLPGNPHQGELVPVDSIALTELGVFQFSEMDRDTEQFAESDWNSTPDGKHHYRVAVEKGKHKLYYASGKVPSEGKGGDLISEHANRKKDKKAAVASLKTKISQHAEDGSEDITKGKKKKKKEDGTDEDETVNENEEDMNEKNPQFAEGKVTGKFFSHADDKDGSKFSSIVKKHGGEHDTKTNYFSVPKKNAKKFKKELGSFKNGLGLIYKHESDSHIGGPVHYGMDTQHAEYPQFAENYHNIEKLPGKSHHTGYADGVWHIHKEGKKGYRAIHQDRKHPSKSAKTLKEISSHLDSIPSQHAEDEADDEVLLDEMGNERPDSPAETGLPPDIVPINEGTNPDMPPVANDRSKLQAVIAGLNQAANLVLPSDFDFANPGSIDILLAALNTAIKSKQEAEAEAAMETEQQEKGNLTEAPMPFSEEQEHQFAESKNVHEELKAAGWKRAKETDGPRKGSFKGAPYGTVYTHPKIPGDAWVSAGSNNFHHHKDGKPVMSGSAEHAANYTKYHKTKNTHEGYYSSQHTENETQFSESELAALTPKARAIVEKAEADRKQAEQEKLQFAENEKAAKQSLARNNSLTKIKSYGLPPYVVKQLTASMNTIQFSEDGKAQPTYTIEDVAAIIKRAMPASMMFAEADVKEANGHVDAATARQVVANNPMLKSTRHGATQPHASVASINEFLKNDLKAHPLNTMK